jgi:release factor glutamine methyltransferase
LQADAPKEWTVGEIARWATDDFRARGLESPRLEAELLVAFALGISRMEVIVEGSRLLEPKELGTLRELVKRRRSHEPMAYLRGEREFYGLVFKVDKRVLVPRPDTEALVDVALGRTTDFALGGRILDLCTGSGCVAITLAKQRPTADVIATDLSNDALVVARENAIRLGAYNVSFLEGDLFGAIDRAHLPWTPARFELVVSNPPYIATAECATLMPDVRDFEPRMALDGGTDGLDFYRRIVAESPGRMTPRGVLAVEVGAGQAESVASLFREAGFTGIEVKKDLGQIDRVVSGVRP